MTVPPIKIVLSSIVVFVFWGLPVIVLKMASLMFEFHDSNDVPDIGGNEKSAEMLAWSALVN